MNGERDRLAKEIELQKEQISSLQKTLQDAETKLLVFEQRMREFAELRQPRTSMLLLPDEKVNLFRTLFRGREDVYPKLWENPKQNKKGYAPACGNEWVRGVCDKPRVKCGECLNQAFLPVIDQAILGHLQGRHTMGVYPLLKDETCWFLAVDFDKGDWRDDVNAFVETCRRAGLSPAIERSRSGNGAHAWFFFTAPIPAGVARNMGCHLVTETMAQRHQLSMDSYDRLFPSQDTMPRGGFGNLIALPLQYLPRRKGNSVFLDEELNPFPDDQQWEYLASLPQIEPAVVERIARKAISQSSVVGVRFSETSDEEARMPWSRPPSGSHRKLVITEPLPKEIHAVLAQKIFIEKGNLPSPLINQIKRLAAFQNPEFYKKQRMRLSTAMTPRVITCAEDLPQHVALPKGCLDGLKELLIGLNVDLEIEDARVAGGPVGFQFEGELTPIQESAVNALLKHDSGVFVAPPGVGKTVVGTFLVAERQCSTLILVHRRPLLDQWVTQLSLFLQIDPKEVGQIGAGKKTGNGRLDVAMIQSLVRKEKVQDIVANYGQVIVDECHHLPAVSFERVLSEVKARYVVGLTATPHRRDGHHPITEMQLGPVRFAVDAKAQAVLRPFAHHLIVRETQFMNVSKTTTIQEIYGALAQDEKRNELILNDIIQALELGRSPILLTERKDHLDYFVQRLQKFTRHLIVLQGGMNTKSRRAVFENLASIPDNEERLVLATGRYVGEGFDDARLDTLFLALPVSWKGTLIQYTGRLHRLHPKKQVVQIFDYVDAEVPMLARMFEKRLRGYRAIGYARDESPLCYSPPIEDTTIEYDE